MVITEKRGNLNEVEIRQRSVDRFPMEWFETGKRILTRTSSGGKEIMLRYLKENPGWSQGDILYEDDRVIVAVEIMPCEAIRVVPRNSLEMAAICYEIGNQHLPLFYDEGALLIPFENPLFRWLSSRGFLTEKLITQLTMPLRTTVMPHETASSESLFSKVLRFTQKSASEK